MKYLTILKIIVHYVLACSGKLIGYIVTPLVYPHRDWLRKDLNGTNLVTRIYFGKPIDKEG